MILICLITTKICNLNCIEFPKICSFVNKPSKSFFPKLIFCAGHSGFEQSNGMLFQRMAPKPTPLKHACHSITNYAAVIVTHWGRDEMAAFSQTTFSSAFPWMRTFEFRIKFHWNMFFDVSLTMWHTGSDNGLAPVSIKANYTVYRCKKIIFTTCLKIKTMSSGFGYSVKIIQN